VKVIKLFLFANLIIILTGCSSTPPKSNISTTELEKYFFNSPTFNNFSSIKALELPAGTRAQILNKKMLSTGDYALQIKIINFALKNEIVWTYNDSKNTPLSFFNEDSFEKTDVKPTVEEAKYLIISKKNIGLINEKSVSSYAKLRLIKDYYINNTINENSSQSITQNFNSYDWHAPANCTSKQNNNYSVCIRQPSGTLARFNIQNRGPNKIVPIKGDVEGRTWTFIVNDGSRQAAAIRVSDLFSKHDSQAREMALILFPRKVTQSILVSGAEQIVTLSTGEKVIYDRKTGEILSGVLSEDNPVGSGKPAISYSGDGVMLRADSRGQDPRVNGHVVITKKNHKPCHVNIKEIFVRQPAQTDFRFADDESFDQFIKTQCGFRIN
jgi:hypothetical protein